MLMQLLFAVQSIATPVVQAPELASSVPAVSHQRSLATARAELADMERLARTPEEKKLVEQDRLLVMRAERVAAARASGNQQALLDATKQMQETQMSFNLQYLQLQSQMQHENRSYTAISNIMKTKHDTVKNSISNIR